MRNTIRIEPYRPLGVRTPGVPGGGYIDVDASAGRFGPSLGWPFGVGIAEGLGVLAPAVAEQLGRDNEAVVKGADTRLGEAERTLLSDPQHGYLNTQGQDAVTRSAAVLEAYELAQDREADALGDDDQRRMFDELAPRRLEAFTAQVERHAAAERRRWHDAASDRRIARAREDAGRHWNDDALLRRALGTARVELRDKAERHGWDTPHLQAGLRQETSRALVAAIEAAVERDADRAGALRECYGRHIDAGDLAALDALLDEAHTRRASEEASEAIRDGRASGADGDGPAPPLDARTGRPTLDWQLEQAEAIAEPTVRAAAIGRLRSAHAEAEAAAEARARDLGEQVLARVVKDGLTDASQVPVREWVALDIERRQAIEALLDHNLRGDEPAPNPALVDELATQMTGAPRTFASRDLVPLVSRLPTAQWQRFREWQASLRRNDSATEERLYVKRGLRIAEKMLPDAPDAIAMNYRAELVEEIDTWRRVNGKSPDDTDIADILRRVELPSATFDLLQAGGGRPPRGPRRNVSPPEQARIDQYNQGLQRVLRYDRGHTEVQSRDWVPTHQDVARITARAEAYERIHQFFAKRGISLGPHVYPRMYGRETRGVTPETVLDAYNNGRLLHDPGTRDSTSGYRSGTNYIRRDTQTGVTVVVTKPRRGEIVTVFEGKPQSRWNHVPYR